MSTVAEKPVAGMGTIEAGVCYPLEQFKSRSGMSDWAMRMARRQGLRVRTSGRRRWVLGQDFLSFLERQDETT